jgi:hypothetical protein
MTAAPAQCAARRTAVASYRFLRLKGGEGCKRDYAITRDKVIHVLRLTIGTVTRLGSQAVPLAIQGKPSAVTHSDTVGPGL